MVPEEEEFNKTAETCFERGKDKKWKSARKNPYTGYSFFLSHQARIGPKGVRYDMKTGASEWNVLDDTVKSRFQKEADKLNERLVPIIKLKAEEAAKADSKMPYKGSKTHKDAMNTSMRSSISEVSISLLTYIQPKKPGS